jgi:hypothetical protein
VGIVVQKIEEASMNAWPALQAHLYDGWVLRFADGYTRRANSVNPIYGSTIDIEEKISYCHKLFRYKGLNLVFKMTRDVYPADLDQILMDYQYSRKADSFVYMIDLSVVKIGETPVTHDSIDLEDRWLNAFVRLNDVVKHKPTLQSMLNNLVQPRCFTHIEDKGRIVACGLAVLEQDMVWLFDITVNEDFRKQGFGNQVTHSLLRWARSMKAQRAYLQVMQENEPALHLYRKLGFKEEYKYWYRTRS